MDQSLLLECLNMSMHTLCRKWRENPAQMVSHLQSLDTDRQTRLTSGEFGLPANKGRACKPWQRKDQTWAGLSQFNNKHIRVYNKSHTGSLLYQWLSHRPTDNYNLTDIRDKQKLMSADRSDLSAPLFTESVHHCSRLRHSQPQWALCTRFTMLTEQQIFYLHQNMLISTWRSVTSHSTMHAFGFSSPVRFNQTFP